MPKPALMTHTHWKDKTGKVFAAGRSDELKLIDVYLEEFHKPGTDWPKHLRSLDQALTAWGVHDDIQVAQDSFVGDFVVPDDFAATGPGESMCAHPGPGHPGGTTLAERGWSQPQRTPPKPGPGGQGEPERKCVRSGPGATAAEAIAGARFPPRTGFATNGECPSEPSTPVTISTRPGRRFLPEISRNRRLRDMKALNAEGR